MRYFGEAVSHSCESCWSHVENFVIISSYQVEINNPNLIFTNLSVMFSKRGREYGRLAKAFGRLYIKLKDIESRVKESSDMDISAIQYSLMEVAYLYTTEITERQVEYLWPLQTPIYIPALTRRRLTLSQAMYLTIEKLSNISIEIGCYKEVSKLLEKGPELEAFNTLYKLDLLRSKGMY